MYIGQDGQYYTDEGELATQAEIRAQGLQELGALIVSFGFCIWGVIWLIGLFTFMAEPFLGSVIFDLAVILVFITGGWGTGNLTLNTAIAFGAGVLAGRTNTFN